MEGIIKYRCNWQKGTSPTTEEISELNEYRSELHKFGLIGAYPNGIGYGNISIRVPNTNKFIITGSQTGHLAVLEPSHFVLVDDFSIEENSISCVGEIMASSESLSHAAIYQALPKVNAVVHIHNLDMWNNLMFNEVTTNPDLAYGTVELAQEIISLTSQIDPEKNKIMVLGGHEEGIISYGTDLFDATGALLQKLF